MIAAPERTYTSSPATGDGEGLADSEADSDGEWLGERDGEEEGELDLLALGERLALGEGLALAETLALKLAEGDEDTLELGLGDTEAEGEGLALSLAEGEAEADGYTAKTSNSPQTPYSTPRSPSPLRSALKTVSIKSSSVYGPASPVVPSQNRESSAIMCTPYIETRRP